ncbi:MAG: 1-acyl-sn-glycerol-3-phosphate acyltransferase [Butyrivibrio sp.]|nr:1-acyl-sn-glycerol-3-phosphate acyltransferase [Acetatifactor muris]MCM1558792.1 1-acyl-sn-glycerol-3-phosphate acyltransferase [Butyrivibrio sp.]
MLRLGFVVVVSLPFIIYYLSKAKIMEKRKGNFSEEKRYKMARRCIRIMMRHGRIETECTGLEHLPGEGGYVMYPNHQGKYDSLGIMYAHPRPCTLVMDYDRSRLPIVSPFIDLVQGKRLDKRDMRSQVKTILQIADEVAAGRRYIVFPEGGYDHNKNDVQDFMPGAFKCATRAKAPIVPVALIDSYKPFGMNSLKKVRTQVHFLKPLFYAEYKEMTTLQIAELVKSRIGEEVGRRIKVLPRT